jgi:hypothetical protein
MDAKRRATLVAAAIALVACVQAGAATWNCYTIYDLENAMRNYAPGDELVIYPGTYYEEAYLRFSRGAVTIRGSTGNRDDVIIQGPGINTNLDPKEGLVLISDDITVKDLTIRGFYYNGIHVQGESDCDRPIIRNVKIIDCGERYIKGSTNTGNSSAVVDNLLIEDCYMEQITSLSGHPDNDYVGGIDMMGLNAPVIRRNVFKNIRGATGAGRGAIFLWNGINNCTVERNQIISCDRGICIGNPGAPSHAYMPGYHSSGGIVRSNMVLRGAYIGMELCFTNNLKVSHNTVYSADASYFRTLHLYDSAGQTNNLQMSYNIIRGQTLDNATGTHYSTGDITGYTPQANWFVDPANGNFHLTSNATSCFDAAPLTADVPTDYDGEMRPFRPDIGADETQIAFKQDTGSDGILCIDVENCVRYYNRGGDSWSFVTSPTGWAGTGALNSLPNDGTTRNSDYVSYAPRLDYYVYFNKTGTHYAWIRGYAANGNDDSCHVGLDNAASSTSDRIDGFGTGAYRWSKHTMDGTNAYLSIGSTGERTLNVYMREDGFIIDRVLLTTNASYTPSGAGPSQSPR